LLFLIGVYKFDKELLFEISVGVAAAYLWEEIKKFKPKI
jgi:hypothetical protein